MPIEITLTLTDEELVRFQERVDIGHERVAGDAQASEVETAAAAFIGMTRAQELPEYIAGKIAKLQVLVDMLQDDEWQLTDEERQSIRSALYYFVDPDDVIPDDTPGIGLLDDAIYADIVLRALSGEVNSYEEFCQYRSAEEDRRRGKGLDTHVGREDWLADRRAVLHARMRQGRSLSRNNRGWRLKLL